MKTTTFGKPVYLVKVWHKDEKGYLVPSYTCWIGKSRAKEDYERKVEEYGADNVFIYKAQQCMFD